MEIKEVENFVTKFLVPNFDLKLRAVDAKLQANFFLIL